MKKEEPSAPSAKRGILPVPTPQKKIGRSAKVVKKRNVRLDFSAGY